jgi:6-pyruvoyltetrahydropterin/6-carboxytetrahydropterin synthase
VRIWREYGFEAAHWLPNVPDDHKCRRLHGHSYGVEIHVTGRSNAAGWVCDFATIDGAWKSIHAALDHRCLNEVAGLENPTSENLARWIWETIALDGLSRVTIRETVRSGCEYEGDK